MMGQGTRKMSVRPGKKHQEDSIPPKQKNNNEDIGFRKGMKDKLLNKLKNKE